MKFHINEFHGIAGTTYYAITNDGRRETPTYFFRWRAWIAGWFL